MKIGLTYDLKDDYLREGYTEEQTAEFDSPVTIEGLENALAALGFQTERIGNIRHLAARLAQGERWELVFNIAEGLHGYGREAQVPALLEAYGIPYVFSGPLTLALALHKGMAKRVARDSGVPTAPFALVERPEQAAEVALPFPLFVKPVAEGTSKGVEGCSLTRNREELAQACRHLIAKYHQPVLVETFLPGREFTVGLVGQGDGTRVLGVLEVHLNERADQGFYSFDNKEQYLERVSYQLASGPEAQAAAEVALQSWRALDCRDGGRVDVRQDAGGQPCFIEVNPLAGLHPVRSDLVILARALGHDHGWLIGQIMAAACQRLGWPLPAQAQAAHAQTAQAQTAQAQTAQAQTAQAQTAQA